METNAIWQTVHRERHVLIGDVSHLSPEQWTMPSLCEGWTVHDVLTHLVNDARTTKAGFVLALLRARFNFDRLNQKGLERERRGYARRDAGGLQGRERSHQQCPRA